MKLEQYRKTIKCRIFLCSLYCCCMLLPNVFLAYFFHVASFTYFILGLMAGFEVIAIRKIIQYRSLLKDEEKLQACYIQEHDERRHMIQRNVSANAIPLIFTLLTLSMPIAGFFSKIVFFTLLGVILLICIVMLSLKLYFNRTM